MAVTIPASEFQRDGKAGPMVMSAGAFDKRTDELNTARSSDSQVKDDITREYEDYLANHCLPADEAFDAIERARGMR